MAAEHTFDYGLVFDPTTMAPVKNTRGVLRLTVGGAPQQIYDMQGTPIDYLETNDRGIFTQFRADIPLGVLDFGSVPMPVSSKQAQLAGVEASQARDAARAAQEAAEDARGKAQAAALAAALAAGLSPGEGGSPAGALVPDESGIPFYVIGGN